MSVLKKYSFKAYTSLITELETEFAASQKNFGKKSYTLLMINVYDAKSYVTHFRRRSFPNYILAS